MKQKTLTIKKQVIDYQPPKDRIKWAKQQLTKYIFENKGKYPPGRHVDTLVYNMIKIGDAKSVMEHYYSTPDKIKDLEFGIA